MYFKVNTGFNTKTENTIPLQDKFEDSKSVIRRLIDDTTTQKKIDKTTNNDLPNIKQKTKDRPCYSCYQLKTS